MDEDYGQIWIKKKLRANGITQVILEDKTGIFQSAWSRILNNRQSMRIKELVMLASIIKSDKTLVLNMYLQDGGK